jgi:hypothetical protein
MTGRDERGRFAPGNADASKGGQARAERLTPARRREIARAGWRAMVERHFGGDEQAAGEWLGRLGAWAADAAYRGTIPVFEHPGPMPF